MRTRPPLHTDILRPVVVRIVVPMPLLCIVLGDEFVDLRVEHASDEEGSLEQIERTCEDTTTSGQFESSFRGIDKNLPAR